MKPILIAPDSFKSSLCATEVAKTIEKAVKTIFPATPTITIPMADGGEGTMKSLKSTMNGETISLKVSGPRIKQKVQATYLISELKVKTAFIEMASASGLELLKKREQNPLLTTSIGTGELIRDAYNKGCKEITVAIGGSATCDGGIGALCVLGFSFLDKHSNPLEPIGANLIKISSILKNKEDPFIRDILDGDVTIKIACDVINPLNGINGAARVFAAQKGADSKGVLLLEKGLLNLTKISNGEDNAVISGSGAAGGVGYGLSHFLDGKLTSGFSLISDMLDLPKLINSSSFVITGEGNFDNQSYMGKLVGQILTIASDKKKQVVVLCGSNNSENSGSNDENENLIIKPIPNRPMSLNDSIKETKQLLFNSTITICKLIKLGSSLEKDNFKR